MKRLSTLVMFGISLFTLVACQPESEVEMAGSTATEVEQTRNENQVVTDLDVKVERAGDEVRVNQMSDVNADDDLVLPKE